MGWTDTLVPRVMQFSRSSRSISKLLPCRLVSSYSAACKQPSARCNILSNIKMGWETYHRPHNLVGGKGRGDDSKDNREKLEEMHGC